MTDFDALQRLASQIQPDDAFKNRVKARVAARIVSPIHELASQVTPDIAVKTRLRGRVMQRIGSVGLSRTLPALAQLQHLALDKQAALRTRILAGLEPIGMSVAGSTLRWTAAFAVFVLIVRAMPLVLLAPTTQAQNGVQLSSPQGDVSVSVGGVWMPVLKTEVLYSPGLIRTGEGQVTIVLNDDGVIRLGPNTTIRLHDLTDRPQAVLSGPTVTLLKGQMWVLGLLPPSFDPLKVETSAGMVALNSASVAVEESKGVVTTSVFDRGAIFSRGEQTTFLISGERLVSDADDPLLSEQMEETQFAAEWVDRNLNQDAVHRQEIAQLQQQRRQEMAGILPNSLLYPVKRVAEEVDVLFTLGQDAKAQKRIQQADTRLNEALALLQDGQQQQASEQLSEYRTTLVSLASGTGDNLVKFLIKKQIQEASISLAITTPDDELYSLKQAVMDVSSALPDANLSSTDIQGYVLVDKLAALNQSITSTKNLTGALIAYAEIQPYIQSLLANDSGAHPLLKKEAASLLASTSSLLEKLVAISGDNQAAESVQKDIAQYLPAEPEEQEKVLVSEEMLNRRVSEIVDRIFVFSMPRSRYNQLLAEMHGLEGDPNRGTLLRRLYHALPENGLAGYVRTEIQKLGDELRNEN